MSHPILARLREELQELTRIVLARAAAARFVRIDGNRGDTVTVLKADQEKRFEAADDRARLERWQRTVTSILRRRGAVMAADALDRLASELDPYVLLTRSDIADITEGQWRAAFESELRTRFLELARILDDAKDAFSVVQRRQATAYESFDVRIWSVAGNRWSVEGAGVRAGVVLSLERPSADRIVEADLDWLVEYGQTLFRSVFGRQLMAEYHRRVDEAASRGCGVRMQFHLEEARKLSSLPWELLHDGIRFLSLSRGTPIARSIDARARPRLSAPSRPIRVLLTVSSPRSLPWLDADRECELLCGALAPLEMLGLMEVHVAPDGSIDTLRRMLRSADDLGRPFHVWHFIGHGEYDEQTARGALAMTGQNGDVHAIGGWELGALFEEHAQLRLVFLNACEGARGQAGVAMSGAAKALIESGVPAVVAMHFPISDEAATVFAEEVYGALTDGANLDDAVIEGRRGVFFRPGLAEWFTPVVFVRQSPTAHDLFQPYGKTQR